MLRLDQPLYEAAATPFLSIATHTSPASPWILSWIVIMAWYIQEKVFIFYLMQLISGLSIKMKQSW